MNSTEKKGIPSNIVDSKKSGCCNVKIEKVVEEQKEPAEQKPRTNESTSIKQGRSYCG